MRYSILQYLLLGALVLGAAIPVDAQTADPVSVLKSQAGFLEKSEACRVLQLKGGPEAVPALESLLADPKLSHMARWALEAMPCPEAATALRNALNTTSGLLKTGIINSLAVRGDAQAVPELAKMLSAGNDPLVTQTAAQALAAIASPEAIQALLGLAARSDIDPVNQEAFEDAQLRCADLLLAKGQSDQAYPLFESLLKAKDTNKQAAALRGAILARGPQQGLSLLLEGLRSDSADSFDSALRAARELAANEDISIALAGALKDLPSDRKIALLDVLGYRGGNIGPALMTEAAAGPSDVRVAALRTLVRIAYVPALDLAKSLLWSDDLALAQAARDAVSYFPGKGGDAILIAFMQSEKAEERRLAIELMGKGALDAPLDLLLAAAKNDTDEQNRAAALDAGRPFVGMDQLTALIDLLLAARSDLELSANEKTIAALCTRQRQKSLGNVVIQEAVYGNLPDGPLADVTTKVAQMAAAGAKSVDASNANFGDSAPGLVKKLRVNYTVDGVSVSQTVQETSTLIFNTAGLPASIVDAFCVALAPAQNGAKLALLRLLGGTGSEKALETVRNTAAQNEGQIKEEALRVLCEWPSADALPSIMELATASADPTMKTLALRGAVRLLGQIQPATSDVLQQYATLMGQAETPEEKKLVLSGLAKIPQGDAFQLVLRQFSDDTVKAEAVQAAMAIAKALGTSAREDTAFLTADDPGGWQGDIKYWRFEDGVVVGQSNSQIPKSEFLWAGAEVRDFYLAVDVKLEPPTANSGIQFRSQKIDDHGQALGYQADIGQDVWGRIYHEHGRGKLDWTDRADKAVKPGDWNRYEILAVGPAIWLAVNGTLGAACLDIRKEGERSGKIAVQLHAGPPQTVRYRFVKLVHDPALAIAGLNAEQLLAALAIPEQ